MKKSFSVGIDIGTYQVKVVVTETVEDAEGRIMPKIIGTGFSESRGLRHGYILNQNDTVNSIKIAIAQAEKAAETKIRRAYISIGGIGLSGVTAHSQTIISRADNEITELDVKKALETCQNTISQTLTNRRIVHNFPIAYKVDGQLVLGKVVGMRGMKLEARVLFITCIEHHISEIVEAVAETGIDVIDVVAAPYAASFVNLSKTQKMAGSLLANIGSETVSIIVFENGNPISLEVFPIGSNDITNDIALVLKIPLEEAEGIKRGTVMGANIQKKKLDEIIQARLSDIFELIEAHLVKINKSGLLPAGIIITGGGSSIETIGELAKNTLRLPSKIASLTVNEKNKNTIKDASWSVAYGLCVYELTRNDDEIITSRTGGIFKAIMNWAKSISP